MTLRLRNEKGSSLSYNEMDTNFSYLRKSIFATDNTETTITGATYTNTGLSASITPLSTSSRIEVIISHVFYYNSTALGMGLRLLRNGDVIFDPSPANATGPYLVSTNSDFYSHVTFTFIDLPNSVDLVTYTTQGRPYTSTGSLIMNIGGGTSTILLREIAG